MNEPTTTKRSLLGPVLMIGGGLLTVGGIIFAVKKSSDTVRDIEKAVEAPPVALPPTPQAIALLPTFKARLTGYYPFKEGLTAKQRLMEGGKNDRTGRPLMTIEDHLSDPIKFPYVSVSADPKIFPYGQRLQIDAWPNAVFRVVDTGDNFSGIKKTYRIIGFEPLDICQFSSEFQKPKTAVVKIIPGDHFADKTKKTVKEIMTAGLKDQTVALTGEFSPVILEGRTTDDYEALSRAVESELGSRTREEQTAAAWAVRNRADDIGMSIHQLLAPLGLYGVPVKSGGYVSTHQPATATSRSVTEEVLGAWSFNDPTGGAVEFWMPEAQARLRQLGDVHRAAKKKGDHKKAKQYERFAGYDDEGDVRVGHARNGLRVVNVIGAVELLGKI